MPLIFVPREIDPLYKFCTTTSKNQINIKTKNIEKQQRQTKKKQQPLNWLIKKPTTTVINNNERQWDRSLAVLPQNQREKRGQDRAGEGAAVSPCNKTQTIPISYVLSFSNLVVHDDRWRVRQCREQTQI